VQSKFQASVPNYCTAHSPLHGTRAMMSGMFSVPIFEKAKHFFPRWFSEADDVSALGCTIQPG